MAFHKVVVSGEHTTEVVGSHPENGLVGWDLSIGGHNPHIAILGVLEIGQDVIGDTFLVAETHGLTLILDVVGIARDDLLL